MRRITTLLAAEAANTAGTKVIDIDSSDIISRIVLQFKATNSTGVPAAHPAKQISKIEICDGSDVLFSLSGIEAQALNFYEEDERPVHANMYVNDVMTQSTFHINFGRFLWDTKYALDPARFSNLQLKVTHNKASGGGTPDAGSISAFAMVMDKTDSSPIAFLMAKEIQSYTLTSSAHEYITLPTDYPYRRLIIQSLAAGKQPWEQYNKVKLSVDNDKQVLINNMSTSDLLKIFPHREFTELLVGTGTGSAEGTYCTPGMWAFAALAPLASALSAASVLTQAYGGYLTVLADSGELFQLLIHGKCPHNSMQIPFGEPLEPSTYLDVSKMASLKFDITAGSSVGSSSTCEIVSSQVRSYK